MSKLQTSKPLLIMLYGFPGAGKTHFARQLSDILSAAHVHGDRIRGELFEVPTHNKQEDDVIEHLMHYMAEEFLKSGISVVYDTNAGRLAHRRELRDMGRKAGAQPLLIWLQIDPDTALMRLGNRDRRKSDDKYSKTYDRPDFEKHISHMQNPNNEEYMVISGKHTFTTQKSALMKKLYDYGLVNADLASNQVIKPGLVNLIPNPKLGRVDMSRRNIMIR